MKRVVLSAAVVLVSFQHEANAFCGEPSVPSCAMRYGPFSDQYEFEDCKRRMESYQRDVEHFGQCQSNAAREAQQQIETAIADNRRIITDHNDAVEHFNRRARGH